MVLMALYRGGILVVITKTCDVRRVTTHPENWKSHCIAKQSGKMGKSPGNPNQFLQHVMAKRLHDKMEL